MATYLKGWGPLPAIVAGILVGCLAAPARGDELQFLPDGTQIVMSVNFQDLSKGKAFQEMKRLMKQFAGDKVDIEAEISKGLGVPVANIARLTMGMAYGVKGQDLGDGIIGIVTAAKAVTAADVIAAKKPPKYKKNVKYKEVKVGRFTIHEETYQYQFDEKDKLGDVQYGETFCVAEGKLVLLGRTEGLKKVLQRDKNPELSANLQAGLKHAGFSDLAIAVIDIQGMPERERNGMFKGLGVAGLKEVADNLQTLAIKTNEKEKITASATLFCKDAASTREVKKITEARLTDLKGLVLRLAKVPSDLQEIQKAALAILDAVKLSANENQASAEVTTDPATAVKFFMGLFVARSSADSPGPAKEATEAKEEASLAPASETPQHIKLKDGDHIIFFGDSLTQLAGTEQPKEHVKKGYVRIVAETLAQTHKDLKLQVDWVATGGHRVTNLLARVDKDVLAKKPTIVFIQIGVNDAAGGVTPEQFKKQQEELIGRLQKGGAQVVLCSLTSLGEKHDGSNRIDQKLDALADVARTVAREQRIPLNDLRKAFVEHWKKNNPDNKGSGILTYDGNHFNDAGMRFVAEQMLKMLK